MRKLIFVLIALSLTITAYSQKGDKGVFDNAVYIRAGYALPGGTLKDAEAVTAGGQFEVGTIFYIKEVRLPEKLKFGVDATFGSISGFYNQKMSSGENKTDSYFTAGFKVGPALSYNFAGNCIADIYVKLHSNKFFTGEDENKHYHAKDQSAFGTSVGLNFRWKALLLGYEFTTCSYDFDVIPGVESSTSGKISLPVSNLSLGVKF